MLLIPQKRDFFRSLFSLWGLILVSTKPHRLKPAPLKSYLENVTGQKQHQLRQEKIGDQNEH